MKRVVGATLQLLGVAVWVGGAILNGAFEDGLTDNRFPASTSWVLAIVAGLVLAVVGERIRTGRWPKTGSWPRGDRSE